DPVRGGSKSDAACETSGSGGCERDRNRSDCAGQQRERQGEVTRRKSCATHGRLRDDDIGPTAVRKIHSAGLVGPNVDISKDDLSGTRYKPSEGDTDA